MNDKAQGKIHSSDYIELMSKIAFALRDAGFGISDYHISRNKLEINFIVSGTPGDAQEKSHAFMHAFFTHSAK